MSARNFITVSSAGAGQRGAYARAARKRTPVDGTAWGVPTAQPDRWLTLAVRNDAEWQALVRELDEPAASSDPRFATRDARLRHRGEIDVLLTQWLAACNADGTAERLQRAGICAHVSWSMQDIAADPHLRARGATTEVSGPGIAPRLAVGAPARFSKTHDVGIRRLTPAAGELFLMDQDDQDR